MEWSLPIELTEKIFLNLDGCSLARASLVCKKWHDYVCNLTRLHNIWEVCCKREISAAQLIKIIDKLFPIYSVSRQGEIDWFLLYRCWFVWKNIKNWKVEARVLFPSHDWPIKFLTVCGNWIIYKTDSIDKFTGYNCKSKISLCFSEGEDITDIDLKNNLRFACVSLSALGETGNKHNHRCRRVPLLILREWLLYFFKNSSAKMYSIGLPCDNLMDSWDDWMLTVFCNEFGEHWLPSNQENVHNFTGISIKKINYWYQLNGSVLLGIAYEACHALFFVINGKSKGYLPPHQLFTIETAFLYCNVLFLGNDRGSVFAYKLNSDEDLLDINFSMYDKRFDVSNIAINAIDVQYDFECSKKEIPFIVVSTDRSIYRIGLSE